MKSKTVSDLRMGSNGKHIELTLWKACLVYIKVCAAVQLSNLCKY